MNAHPEMTIRVVGTEDEWQAARRVRREVFIHEQACPPDEEWDEYDATSRHLIGVVDAKTRSGNHLREEPAGETVATARWREVQHEGRTMAKLERFAVRKPFRGRGYGRQLVQTAIEDAQEAGHTRFILHAQAHLEAFYASFGFASTGHRFDEVGIPHVEMTRSNGA